MEGRAAFLRVGLLIVAGMAVLVALVWFLGGNRFTDGRSYESYFRESVQGLEVGAPTKYRGVTVGRVTQIGLISAEYGAKLKNDLSDITYRMVFVRYIIDRSKLGQVPSTKEAIASGLRVRLASSGITGVAYLELDFVNPARYPADDISWTPHGEYIPSMPSTLTQVQDAAQTLLTRLDKIDIVGVSENLVGLLQDIRAQLSSGDVAHVVGGSARLLETLNNSVKQADLSGLITDLTHTSTALRALVQDPEIRQAINGGAKAADRLAAVAAQLQPLISSLQATTRRADNGSADIQQALIPLLRDIQAVTSNLREVTANLRQNPGQVLLGAPPPPRMGVGR